MPYNNFVLINYLGDESAATDFPHGNRKHDSRKHVRTCPSVLSDLKAQCYKHRSGLVDLLEEYWPGITF